MRPLILATIVVAFPLAASGQIMVGPEFQVNTYTTSAQAGPSVSHGSDGSFVVVWQSYGQDGSGAAVEGQRYDSTGTPSGDEFQVNSYTTNSQYNPSVSHGSDGFFVVVWESYEQDGSGSAVEGQRFCSDSSAVCAEIFADGFESGDTSAWSNAVP